MVTQSPLSVHQAIVNKDGTPTAWFIRLWQQQLAVNVTAVQDSDLVMNATTVNNASFDKHGFLPALSGDATEYLDGTGNWSVPPGGDTTGLLFDAMAVESGDPYIFLDFGA